MPKLLALLSFAILSNSMGADLSPSAKAFQQVEQAHHQLESYFAVYEGTAPGGKRINAVIAYHQDGLAAVQAQFLIADKVIASPLQVSTPELGLVLGDANTVQLKNAHLTFTKLAHIISLFTNQKDPLGSWSPALSLTKETAAAQLTLSARQLVPWLRDGLPEQTELTQTEEHFQFKTSDHCHFEVQKKTGILEKQNYPNEQGDRTLVLKSLQTNLSREELDAFILQIIPTTIRQMPVREHPLFTQVQLQALAQIIAEVDSEAMSLQTFKNRLQPSRDLFLDYLQHIYPDADNQLAGRPKWETAISHLQQNKTKELKNDLAQIIRTDWQCPLLLESDTLTGKTPAGQAAARLLTETLNKVFLELAITQALSHK